MTQAQQNAANPEYSVWVAASAGTGKTKVLTDRVLRILLTGTHPGKILCLTFTNAAAAEMANRINSELAKWVTLPDEILKEIINKLTNKPSDNEELNLARRLFAKVLDTPDGLKIQTIHSFCQTLIKRFPLEAGVPPHFQVMDDQTSKELLKESQSSWISHLSKNSDLSASEALERIAGRLSDSTFNELLAQALTKRGNIEWLLKSYSLDELSNKLYEHLGLKPNITQQDILSQACKIDKNAEDNLYKSALLLQQASKKFIESGQSLEKWLKLKNEERINKWNDYVNIFLTSTLEPRKKIIDKKNADKFPEIKEILEYEQQRILKVIDQLNSAHIVSSTSDLFLVINMILDLYHKEKENRAFLDYEDLILSSERLLHLENIAPWILFKLDGGIDHLLVDEAQDTSPAQWKIIESLCQEFFSGDSARNENRTIFIVGDEKQSIYSFQGADPAVFNKMQLTFADKIQQAKKGWENIFLDTSFRSTVPILKCVDAIFANDNLKEAITNQKDKVYHNAFRLKHSGKVELWPLEHKEEVNELEPWSITNIRIDNNNPQQKLADKIAETIANWILIKRPLPSTGKPIQPSDIMILVRKRNNLLDKIVRSLKKRNIPVAGVDRMILTDHIAIEDLIALGNFLLLPNDDLTLACVLKSPFIGINEEELFNLCTNSERKLNNKSLWKVLESKQNNPVYKKAYEYLKDLLTRTDFNMPFELYSYILEVKNGRKSLANRLGNEIHDPVDEFLRFAITFEKTHNPTLQGFLSWIKSGNAEIKRDLEQSSNQVRIMTVHGSKGLQAPIIFLPDTTSIPLNNNTIFWDNNTNPSLPLWVSSSKYKNSLCKELKINLNNLEYSEYLRLLYVALTRAEDELYITGYSNKKNISENSWYKIAEKSLEKIAEKKDNGTLELYYQGNQNKLETITNNIPDEKKNLNLPGYLQNKAPQEQKPPRPLAPSNIEQNNPAPNSLLAEQSMLRGKIIHSLLQFLPQIEKSKHKNAINNYLNKYKKQLPEDTLNNIHSNINKILENNNFSSVFSKHSIAEVPVTGIVDNSVVSGQIDRLAINDNEVMIIDYKTNRIAPTSKDKIPSAYISQMNLYRKLVEQIFPKKKISAAIIWTENGTLMEL